MRWLFRLEFCTPRYIMTKELRMDKLGIGWGIRAMRFEEKILSKENEDEDSLLWKC